jgi:hypothetical protein
MASRQNHSISGISAAVEHQSSMSGLTLTDRRTSLNPEKLDNTLGIRAAEKNG